MESSHIKEGSRSMMQETLPLPHTATKNPGSGRGATSTTVIPQDNSNLV
jgi:hypothetical protein